MDTIIYRINSWGDFMIVVYHDIGGAHSTAVAANIHVNNLPADHVPDKAEILKLPTFDKIQKDDRGHLMYIGEDEFGARVFTIGMFRKEKLIVPAICDMYEIMNGSKEGIYLVDTTPAVNLWMKIGGFSSRNLNLVSFGRPIVTYGTMQVYMKISAIVDSVKKTMKQDIEQKSE